ncbi:glycoside hydrolase family 3 protein [Novosphingobium piscinae]|uniref:beta-glucosidase n=1 Tax=Novosphingobium piscinae TaxID=1507448 RepID=A0A7X1KQY8_9SPHN|nr:glycoside hydrolase family 3 N-terminal domain-containing protein [Novosphingobium piscinae]MBC2670110.1 glycoside hydrolase family 3 C-terminal domain-containing protein [Novosphingobium piscinae]
MTNALPGTGALLGLALAAAVAAPAGADRAAAPRQPELGLRSKTVITVQGLRFRDLDGDGRLTPYEDWRLSPAARAADLVRRMTLAEKAGQLVHGTLPGLGGVVGQSAAGYDLAAATPLIRERHITSFITRLSLPPAQMAEQANAVQALAEAGRLGIPLTISADPRNHFHHVLGAGESAAGVTQWPELLGFAALGDPARVSAFAAIARAEYRAVGIHQALSPQVDLATEPRWGRITGTFGADADLSSRLGGAYVAGFQGSPRGLAPDGVMTVVKHWAGYGAQPEGFDAHNYYGRTARLSTAQLERHIAAFNGALAAGTGGVMPTYPIIVGPRPGGKALEPYGAGYSKVLLTDVLRRRLGFTGILLSDWGITSDCTQRCLAPTAEAPQRPQDISTAWGVESLTVPQRFALGLAAGLDQFGGTQDTAALLAAVQAGGVSEARLDQSVRRILAVKFRQGLFENPYVDPAAAAAAIAAPAGHALAAQTQREAQVLLTNRGLLPLDPAQRRKVWLFGMAPAAATAAGLTVVATPAEADFALIRAESPAELLHPHHFFGGRQKEGRLDFRDGDPAYEALKQARAAGRPVVFAPFLDRPAVLTNVVDQADAILANFGASDAAVLDVVLGRARARGRLPFELPRSMAAVVAQDPAEPDDSRDPLFPRGAGL